jgi:acetyl esterase/lipase
LAQSKPAGSQVLAGHSTLTIPCGRLGRRVPATWYYPTPQAGAPIGLLWVQHGFLRDKRNVADLARNLAETTKSVVVTPTLSSNALALEGCWLNGKPLQAAAAKLFEEGKALAKSARMAGFKETLPEYFVLSGHSAGGNFALSAAGFTTAPGGALPRLKAVVMFDGVDYQGQMTSALNLLKGDAYRPIWQVAAPPSSCNAMGAGTRALLDARPGEFVGVELMNGSHLDAEGANAGIAAALICGRRRPENVAVLRQIAGDWIVNAFTGTQKGIVKGVPGQEIPVGKALAIVLPAP